MSRCLLRLAPLLLSCILAHTATAGLTAEHSVADREKLADGLHFQKGAIVLQNGLAKINVPEDFRFLNGADAEIVLTQLWGNPPGKPPLGMIVPTGLSPAGRGSWAVIVSYDEEGYVKDDDAAKINYDELLKTMEKQTLEANKQREEAGYPAMELIGWAKPPRYDALTHKLYWAKEYHFDGNSTDTLNYNIRVLGRRGVLVLNAVAPIERLSEIEQAAPAVLRMVDFQEGNRYTDFNKSTDKVAAYGIAALIAGGVLAKTGALKMLIPVLIAAKKFIIVGVVAIVAAFKKLFGKISGRGRQDRPGITEL